jgi:hypothetical protein
MFSGKKTGAGGSIFSLISSAQGKCVIRFVSAPFTDYATCRWCPAQEVLQRLKEAKCSFWGMPGELQILFCRIVINPKKCGCYQQKLGFNSQNVGKT